MSPVCRKIETKSLSKQKFEFTLYAIWFVSAIVASRLLSINQLQSANVWLNCFSPPPSLLPLPYHFSGLQTPFCPPSNWHLFLFSSSQWSPLSVYGAIFNSSTCPMLLIINDMLAVWKRLFPVSWNADKSSSDPKFLQFLSSNIQIALPSRKRSASRLLCFKTNLTKIFPNTNSTCASWSSCVKYCRIQRIWVRWWAIFNARHLLNQRHFSSWRTGHMWNNMD